MQIHRYFLFIYVTKEGIKMQRAIGFSPGGDPVAYGEEHIKQNFWKEYAVYEMRIGNKLERI